jgi:hypothetical protein
MSLPPPRCAPQSLAVLAYICFLRLQLRSPGRIHMVFLTQIVTILEASCLGMLPDFLLKMTLYA